MCLKQKQKIALKLTLFIMQYIRKGFTLLFLADRYRVIHSGTNLLICIKSYWLRLLDWYFIREGGFYVKLTKITFPQKTKQKDLFKLCTSNCYLNDFLNLVNVFFIFAHSFRFNDL